MSVGEGCPGRVRLAALGTLSKDDDDGSENIGKKVNLCSFKLNRVYLNPLYMSNAGDFSWTSDGVGVGVVIRSVELMISENSVPIPLTFRL